MTVSDINQHTYAFTVTSACGGHTRIIRAHTVVAAQAKAIEVAEKLALDTGNKYFIQGCGYYEANRRK